MHTLVEKRGPDAIEIEEVELLVPDVRQPVIPSGARDPFTRLTKGPLVASLLGLTGGRSTAR